MCLGIPGQVIELDAQSDLARVTVSGVRRSINVGLLEGQDLAVGDWVLIHVGFALSKIDEEEAGRTLSYLAELGQAYQEELRGLASSRFD